MTVSTLDALLLFLAGHKGLSGYDIRQIFQTSPLGLFSDSPGAIYPALARLHGRGLLDAAEAGTGRKRRVYARTAAGETALHDWTGAPIDPEVMARRAAELDLRFVITAELVSAEAARAFAARCAEAYAAGLRNLETYRAGPGQRNGRASLQALDLGIRIHRTRLEWCRDIAVGREITT